MLDGWRMHNTRAGVYVCGEMGAAHFFPLPLLGNYWGWVNEPVNKWDCVSGEGEKNATKNRDSGWGELTDWRDVSIYIRNFRLQILLLWICQNEISLEISMVWFECLENDWFGEMKTNREPACVRSIFSSGLCQSPSHSISFTFPTPLFCRDTTQNTSRTTKQMLRTRVSHSLVVWCMDG